MEVTTPGGSTSQYTTDGSGLIEIDGIEPGDCDVTCDLEGAKFDDTFHFVSIG